LRDDLISQNALAFQMCVREMAFLVLTNHSLLDALRVLGVLGEQDALRVLGVLGVLGEQDAHH